MERVISATEARIRFGEWMRRAVEHNETIVVQRGGRPYVVLLSFEAYQRLQPARQEHWEQTRQQLHRLRQALYQHLQGRPLEPPPEDLIRQMREERDAQLGLP